VQARVDRVGAEALHFFDLETGDGIYD
jgi:hypothetical protein